MSDREKYMMVLLLFIIWGAFAYTGLTPAAGFIQAIRDCILGLGVFQAALTMPTK